MIPSRFRRFLLAACLALLPAVVAASTGALILKTRTDTGLEGAGGTAAALPPAPADFTQITIGTEINIAATPDPDFVFVRWESDPSGQVANPGKAQTSTYISGDIALTAIFRQKTWKLDLAVSPSLGAPLPAGSGYLPKNAQHTISVTPNAGYEFVEWRIDKGNVMLLGAGSTTDIRLGEPQDAQWSLTAIVKRTDPDINTLTLEADAGGSAKATLGAAVLNVPAGTSAEEDFPLGEGITLRATPAADYSFAGWEGPVAGTGSEASISLSGAAHVRAKFSPMPFNVSVSMANASGGTDVGGSSVSGGNGTPELAISVPTPGPDNANYPMGSVVTLTASPDGEYLFRKWQATQQGIPVALPDDDVNPYSFTVGNKPLAITALFARLADIPLTLHAGAGGSATATGTFSNPLNDEPLTVTVNAIENGSGTGHYLEDTRVTITANPSANFEFDKWTGDVSSGQAGTSPVEVTMSSARTVTAGFRRIRSDLTVTISPAAAATAGARVINADTSADLTGATNHPVNAILALKPAGATSAETAWIFDHWEGDLTGTADPASITLPTDRTVTAVFRQQHVLTLKTDPIYQGNFTVSTGSLSYDSGSGTWTGIYAGGTTVTLTVAPVDSRGFSGWTGDTAGLSAVQLATNPLTVTMDRSRTLIATIDTAARFRIAVMPDRRETMTPVVLPDGEADKIRISGHFSIGGRAYGYIRPFPDAPATVDVAYASTSGSVALSAPELVTDSNDVVWQFVSWATGINEWDAVPQPWGRSHTLNTADLGGSANILALYTDKRALRPTVTLDGFTSTAVNIKADSAVLTTGAEKKYTWNQTAALEAYPQTGVVFSSWGGEAQPDAVDRTRALTTMNVDRTNVIARYKTAIPVTLDIVVEGGSATPSQFAACLTATLPGEETEPVSASLPRIFQVGKGDTITFAATASTVTLDAGLYRFKGWDTDGDGAVDQSGASLSRIADAAQTIRAVFVRTWTLETLTDPAGAGSITRTPASTVYDHGATVILTANNGTGYVFDHWSETSAGSFTGGYQDGTSATDQTIHIVMVADQSLTAHYESAKNALSVNVNVNGTLNPPAHTGNLPFIADGTPLTAPDSKTYNYGEHANITATVPAAGGEYRFAGWNPPASQGTNNPIVVEMLGAQAATAHYKTRCLVTFSVETVGGGTGGAPSVTGHTAMVGSSWACYHGDSITLTANPASGYRFLRWEIDTDGNPATIEITSENPGWSGTIASDWRVKAVYAKEYTVTFQAAPLAAVALGCSVNQPATVTAFHGQVIAPVSALLPSLAEQYGWSFRRWTVAGTEDVSHAFDNSSEPAGHTLVVLSDQTVTALFTQEGAERPLTVNIRLDGKGELHPILPPTHPLHVIADGSTVPGEEAAGNLHSTQSKNYYSGNTVALDASLSYDSGLDALYRFVGWENESHSGAVWNFTMPPATEKTVTALYRTRARLTLAVAPDGYGTTTPAIGTHEVLLHDTVNLTTSPDNIDTQLFSHWTSDTGAAPQDPAVAATTVNMDVTAKTVTAHYVDGHKLDVRVRCETTAATGDAQSWSSPAGGSRTSVASCAGGRAAIYRADPNTLDHSVQTIRVGDTARISAIPAAGYRFIGWDVDGDTSPEHAGSTLDVIMDAPKTITALFERIRVNFTIYTLPADPSLARGEISTGDRLLSGPEPRVYEVFHGSRPALQATAVDARYGFVGWYHGTGYTTDLSTQFSTSASTTCPQALTAENTIVTAYFLPYGLHRLVLFTQPQDQIDISHVSVPGAVSQTYTVIDGRPACVTDVAVGNPSSLVAIHADGGATGKTDGRSYGFYRWIPAPGYEFAAGWITDPFRNDTTVDYPINVPEIRLIATYGTTPAYRLTLRLKFTDETVAVDPEYADGFHDLDNFSDAFGNVVGNTPDLFTSHALLYVNRVVRAKSAIFTEGHIETFGPDATFLSGPFFIDHWEYEKGANPLVTAAGDSFTTTAGIAGTEEIVTVFVDFDWQTISMDQPVFRQPAGWSAPAVSSGSFAFLGYKTTGIPFDIIYPVTVTPVPPPYLLQSKRISGGSAPVLNAPAVSGSGSFRFAGWDASGDGNPDFSGSGFTWDSGWPAAWARTMQEDRVVAPVYIRQLSMTLAMEAPTPSANPVDRAWFSSSSGGLEILASDEAKTKSKTYDFGSTFTVTASPQQFHVLEKWIVEKATADGGGNYDAPQEIPVGAPGAQTLAVTLDYPTRVTAVFALQKFTLAVEAEDGGAHGKIRLNGQPAAGSAGESGIFDYSATPAIEAIPEEGYAFTGWTVSGGANAATPSAPSTTIYVDGNKTVTAHFKRKVTLTMQTDPSGIGQLYPNMISPEVGVHTHLEGNQLVQGAVVRITASNGNTEGYDFVRWTIVDDAHPADNPLVVTNPGHTLALDGDTTATAHYGRLHTLTLQAAPSPDAENSKATASPAPTGSAQPLVAIASPAASATVTGRWREDKPVTLTATGGTHYEFDHWEISVNGIAQPDVTTSTCVLGQLTADTTARAVFKPKIYRVTVVPWSADPAPDIGAPIAATLVSTAPEVHDFLGGVTYIDVPYKTTVTLGATAAEYYEFAKWTDAGHAASLGTDSAAYTFEVSGNATVVAAFKRDKYKLTTAVSPDASYGAITASVPRGGNPSWHVADTAVTLTAVPAVVTPGVTSYLFREWTTTRNGVAEAPGAPASATLELKTDADWTATARFVKAVRIKVDVNAISAVPGTPGGSITGITGYKHQDADGYYVFAEGDPVTITAAANEHFTFSEWTGAPGDAVRTDTGSPATHSKLEFTASADTEITANFTAKTYTLVVTSDPAAAARTLVAHQPLEPDHDFLSQGQELSRQYPQAITLATSAVGATAGDPPPHYRFLTWREGNSALGTSPTLPFIFNRNATLRAVFTRQIEIRVNESLDITRSPEVAGQGGSATLSTSGGQGPFSGVGEYRLDVPDTLRITVTPATGYEFAEWRGLPAGATVDPATGAVSLPLTEALAGAGDLEITPCFRLKLYKVTIGTWDKYTSTADVSGNVTISPDPETGGRYYHGTEVTVTLRQIYYGYRFLGWDANGDREPEVTVFDDPVTCSATFTVTDTMEIVGIFHRIFRLYLNTDPTSGSGIATVTSPPPVSLVAPGTYIFDAGTRVNLLAEPVLPAEFIGWAGDVENPDAETTAVMMTADRSITARFGVQVRHDLAVNVAPAAYGTVLIDDSLTIGGIHAPSATKSYIHGQEADLKATALAGYEFAGWTGDPVIGSAAVAHARVTMTAPRALTANFRIARHELTVRALPVGSGTVTGGGFYNNNQTATLTATPVEGYIFRGWDTDGDGTPDETSGTLSVVVTGDRTIDALFRKIGEDATLTVQVSPSGAATYSITDGDTPNEKIIRVYPAASYTWPEHHAWSGPDSGLLYGHLLDESTGVREARIYLSTDRSVTVSLVPIAVTLTVEAVPSDKGTVTIDPPGGSYTKGSIVVVDATAIDPGFIFKHWEGPVASGDEGSSVIEVTLNTSMKLIAVFEMKPKTYQITLGFDSMSVDHDNDRVVLHNTGSLLFKDRNSQQLSDFFLEGSEIDIKCLLQDHENYGFSSWTGMPSDENVQYTDPDIDGNVTSRLHVTQAMTVGALVQVENPLLLTYAMCEDDDPLTKEPCVSVGGTVSPGGFCRIGDRMIVWAVPNPGWIVIPDIPVPETSGWGTSSIPADQPDATGQPEGAVGYYVDIGAKVTKLTITFVSSGYVPPKASISGGSHELDKPDTRAPRHRIHGTPIPPP
ncbi:conserved repeat protein [Opitutaceae bacterium TAV1]|nr:conserved repeat protein [Opitutaceae bacterium TAV1]